MKGASPSSAIFLLLLLSQAAPGTSSAVNTGTASSAAGGAIDPAAFRSSTPLPRKRLEGVFAGFLLQMVVGGIAEEYFGGLKVEGEISMEEKKHVVDNIYRLTGEYYEGECEDMGLMPPANTSSVPSKAEITHPGYFAAYTYASFRVAWEALRDAAAFRRFQDRLGGRVFDAVSQYASFTPSHDMDDIKGMRKSLKEFLDRYAQLGLAQEAGALFAKGTDKKWKQGAPVTFKVWVDTPVLLDTTTRLQALTGEFKDWLFYIVQRFFTSFLVDAELTGEYMSETEEGRVVMEWTIEPM